MPASDQSDSRLSQGVTTRPSASRFKIDLNRSCIRAVAYAYGSYPSTPTSGAPLKRYACMNPATSYWALHDVYAPLRWARRTGCSSAMQKLANAALLCSP